MVKVGDQGRYGVAVMQSADGTWWWCRELQTLDLVPIGKRTTTLTMYLRPQENNPNGVMRALARQILKQWKPGREDAST